MSDFTFYNGTNVSTVVSTTSPLPASIVTDTGQPNSDANPLIVKAYAGDGTGALLGAIDETAPATDTAAAGLNGRNQRIAQNISALSAPATAGTATATKAALMGATYLSTLPTLTNTQQGPLYQDTRGALHVALKMNDSAAAIQTTINGADAVANSVSGLRVFNFPVHFNGTNWDRVRNNNDQTVGITASGATTTQTGADQTNYNGRGVKVVLDMTVVGSGSVTLSIQGKDVASGKYYTILTGAAVVGNSTNVYTIYPGVTAAANVSVSDVLPRTWRVVVTANNANATTYTVGASLML